MSAVPACNAVELSYAASKNKAIGVGNSAVASHPVLAKYTFLRYFRKQNYILSSYESSQLNNFQEGCEITYVRM